MSTLKASTWPVARPISNAIVPRQARSTTLSTSKGQVEPLLAPPLPDSSSLESNLHSDEKKDSSVRLRSWTPWSLRRTSLLVFALAFSIIAVTLGALNVISHRRQGLCDADSRDHYFWTYTPTALFTIIAVVWSQVEYRIKQLQPWRSMADGPKTANESVLLDYISPWNVIILFKSLKRRQYAVTLAISCSLLVQLLIVLSTGLFTLSTVHRAAVETQLSVHDSFILDASAFDPSQVDYRPVAMTAAVGGLNHTVPSGTTMDSAYERFASPQQIGKAVLSTRAEVNVLSSTMACEAARLYVDIGKHLNYTGTVRGAQSAQCGSFDFSYGDMKVELQGFKFLQCRNISDGDAKRVLLFPSSPGFPEPAYNHHYSYRRSGFPAILCTPAYSLRRKLVTTSRNSVAQVQEAANTTFHPVTHLEGWQLFDAFVNSFREYRPLLDDGEGVVWKWINSVAQAHSTNDGDDAKAMVAKFEHAWSLFSAQLFSLYFRHHIQHHSTIRGTISTKNERISMRAVSFWATEACLLLLIVLTILLALSGSNLSISRDPSNIVGLATVLADSPKFMQDLDGTGSAVRMQLARVLSSTSYYISSDSGNASVIAIHTSRTSRQHPSLDLRREYEKSATKNWYRPFTERLTYQIGLPLYLLAAIVALEVLLTVSQKNNGISSVGNPDSYQHFYWTYAPAFLMGAVTLLIAAQRSTVQIVTPFAALTCAPRPVAALLSLSSFGGRGLSRSFRFPEAALLTSGGSVFVCFFLTIVVSGLYSSLPGLAKKVVHLRQDDFFEMRGVDWSSDGDAAEQMVLNGDLSFPQYTYETLAITKPRLDRSWTSGILDISLPSVRGRLNCTIVPEDALFNETTWVESGKHFTSLHFDSNWGHCHHWESKSSNVVGSVFPGPFSTKSNFSSSGWISGISMVTPELGFFGGFATWNDWDTFNWGNLNCPFAMGAFGHASDHKIEKVSVFTCVPRAEKVLARVKLVLPEEIIIEPPIVDETSCKEFDPDPFIFTYPAPFRYQMNIPVESSKNTFMPVQPSSNTFDWFMSTLIDGTYGIPATKLYGAANEHRLTAAVDRLYGMIFAQFMNGNRGTLPAAHAPNLTGTISTPHGHRLVQSAASTHVLAGLLSSILVLSLATTLSSKTRKVLPQNPCSIAAVASWLAGSNLMKMIQPEWQMMSDKELMARFDGYVFSMGWWEEQEGDEKQKRYGIDIGSADHLR